MKVAAVQMCSQQKVLANLEQAEQLVAEAAQQGASLICLPEGFAYLGEERHRSAVAEEFAKPGPIVTSMRRMAERHGVWLLGGGFPEKSHDPDRPFNTSALWDPRGVVRCTYRKIHLFDVDLDDGTALHESAGSSAGDRIRVASLGQHGLGFSICYDLRFPELFTALRNQGATMITVPSAFTRPTGEAHWRALLRARAIETQCWLIAPAQSGEHPRGRVTYGHSLVVDPWGLVTAELTSGIGVLVVEAPLQQVQNVRRQMPLASHRRSFRAGED